MPVDSEGNVTRPISPMPVSGQDADAPQVNTPIDDLYSAINLMVFLDGRKPLRGNIPMNGNRAIGAADAEGPQDYVTLSQLQSLLASLSQVPTGIMVPMSGTAVPQGWVRANGQTLNRSAHPELWSFAQASGNIAASEAAKTHGQYGPGNGSSTFTVPNLEADGGYFIRPVTSGRGIGSVQQDAFKSHNHGGSTGAGGSHMHTVTAYLATGSGPQIGGGIAGGSNRTINTSTVGNHTHLISSQGGTETRPKNIAYPFIIKT